MTAACRGINLCSSPFFCHSTIIFVVSFRSTYIIVTFSCRCSLPSSPSPYSQSHHIDLFPSAPRPRSSYYIHTYLPYLDPKRCRTSLSAHHGTQSIKQPATRRTTSSYYICNTAITAPPSTVLPGSLLDKDQRKLRRRRRCHPREPAQPRQEEPLRPAKRGLWLLENIIIATRAEQANSSAGQAIAVQQA